MQNDDQDNITNWLQAKAQPLSTTEAVEQDEAHDLAPIKAALAEVDVVGLGEATHGTREFFELRHRLLRYLVRELEFNTLAIEGSYSAGERINDYVLGGEGDRAALLTEMRSVMWDVEEFASVLDWLRAHNASAADERKVHFFGTDVWQTRPGRDQVLTYLREAGASAEAARAGPLFESFDRGESAGLLLAHGYMPDGLADELEKLLRQIDEQREPLIRRTSKEAYERARRHLAVMLQWVHTNVRGPGARGLDNTMRSRFMGENLLAFLSQRRDVAPKVALWAHNYHVNVGFRDPTAGLVPNMGMLLRAELGNRYYAIAFECDRGNYLSRKWLRQFEALGDYQIGELAPSAPDSLTSQLARAGHASWFLDLRGRNVPPAIEEWLRKSHPMHCLGWAYNDPAPVIGVIPATDFDGVVFISSTTPTTPTPNAVKTVAQRTGH
jgi:erythromycin esterase